ncbi:molybdopterin molybdochelatase [Acinetobacter marinus]|uniref:Molybdopterin molybdenumtransferase n=1 Tax=Acinetobacter marinus TaxID=281375 RepID=A0A1G6HA55_9GAMM|nr:molybdopterin molybdotransferase MoeA [Acinetobacter marinus]SDB91033.1 molybdopterin molybdochelatase [Acinetobacter marinus]
MVATVSACGAEKGLISIDQAIEIILQQTQPLSIENKVLQASLHHYLAEDIHAQVNLPTFSQSAVDGYALCFDGENAQDQTFEVIGEIRAGGDQQFQLNHGQAVRIFTGGKIPENTTTVARQEIVQAKQSSITITEPLRADADIRHVGEEVSKEQLLAERGQYLSVGAIAALSMAGVFEVTVFKQPKIAVLITGDEVATSSNDPSMDASSKVFDANGPLLQAWCQSNHFQVDVLHIVDDEAVVNDTFHRLKTQYDVLITTGGVSVGDYDYVRPCALNNGFTQHFWKVKQKPGKPLFFASFQNQDHHCYLLGLPGNPAAVYVCMQVYGKLLLNTLQGNCNTLQWFSATLTQPIKADQRERFIRMVMAFDQGRLTVQPLAKQQSHMLSNLMQANCLVRVPSDRQCEAGDPLQVLML